MAGNQTVILNLYDYMKKSVFRAPVALTLLLAAICTPSEINAAPAISQVTDNRSSYAGNSIPTYKKFEISFTISGTTATNFQWPYDPNPPTGVTPGTGITVNALFSSDNWATSYSQPAFYYQPFDLQLKSDQDWIYPTGSPTWKVRFAPNKSGTWQFKLRAQDSSGTTETQPVSFSVNQSQNHGFVRVSSNDSRYFEFDDGTYFPGLGYNMNWNHISWNNPVSENQDNFIKMGQNGIQLIRLWLSEWAVFGSKWNPWRCILSACSADWPEISTDQSYADHNVSVAMYANYNPCMSSGHWLSAPIAVKANTNYRIRVRVKTSAITGPRVAGQPYGFVAKITDNGISWLQFAGNNCQDPGVGTTVTSYLQNSDWTEISGTYRSTASAEFLSSFYLTLTNVTDGSAFVDQVIMEEDLGSGNFGSNILLKPGMNHHQYIDQNLSARFDKVVELAEQNNVYLRPVVLEWQDDVLNMIDSNGFYGNWRTKTSVRWYQEMWWRYLQARWGYSTAIHSWELLNEGQPWIGEHYTLADEFGKYMKCRTFGVEPGTGDSAKCTYQHPNYHLVSTSFWTDYPKDDFWENSIYPNMDFADIHRYGFRNGTDNWLNIDGSRYYVAQSDPNFYDTALYTQEMSQVIKNSNPKMPVIRGETGLIENGDTNAYTTALDGDIFGTGTNQGQGIWLHNFVWGHINPGGLIESYWYEDYGGRHIYGNKDQRGHFGSYYNFIKDIPLNKGGYVDTAATTSNTNLRAWGQKNTAAGRAHVWIQNKNHTWNNYVPAGITGTVTIGGFQANTQLQVQWYNTYSGTVQSTQTLTTNSSGNLVLSVNNLVTDIAAKIGDYATLSPTPLTTTPTLPPITGDINGDRVVNILDYTLLSNTFGTNNSASDLNKDGTVNILDYTLLSNNFGRTG